MDEFLKRLLEDKEIRYEEQLRLVNKHHKPLLSFMLNIPGIDKNSQVFRDLHKAGVCKIKDLLGQSIVDSVYVEKDTGSYFLASVDMDGEALKRLMVKLEEDDLGRLYDLDVFDKEGVQISRRKLGLSPRSCLVCQGEAKVCIVEKRHSLEEVLGRVHEIIRNQSQGP